MMSGPGAIIAADATCFYCPYTSKQSGTTLALGFDGLQLKTKIKDFFALFSYWDYAEIRLRLGTVLELC